MIFILLIFILFNSCYSYDPTGFYEIQRYSKSFKSHKIFVETNSKYLLEMKSCFPNEIVYLINNITILYKNHDINFVTESTTYNKIYKDLINYKPFCNALKDSMEVYIKRMTYIMTNHFRQSILSKEFRELYNNFNIYDKCLFISKILDDQNNSLISRFGSQLSTGLKCLKLIERNALFNALAQRTKYDQSIL